MSRYLTATTATLALISLAAIPAPARGAVFEVGVGGPGILAYDPPFVVRSWLFMTKLNSLLTLFLI